MITPATETAAMVVPIQFALEPFVNIVYGGKPFLHQQFPGLGRTFSAAAD
jgi:hypothetical protein